MAEPSAWRLRVDPQDKAAETIASALTAKLTASEVNCCSIACGQRRSRWRKECNGRKQVMDLQSNKHTNGHQLSDSTPSRVLQAHFSGLFIRRGRSLCV